MVTPSLPSHVGTLPFLDGSVDGGTRHGIGTFGGALGTPLMIGTICMFATTVYFYVQSVLKPATRKYQYVSMSVTGIATVAYLCMRSNIGVSYVECTADDCGFVDAKAVSSAHGKLYPLFWMRYIDWFFTTPFFLLDLCLLAGADPWDTFFVMLMNAVCITCGAVGALKPSVNVPMFVLGMLTFSVFIHKLLTFKNSNEQRSQHYRKTMVLTMGIWCAYPVMFVLCEMTKTFTTEVEVWMYCILDVAAKCGCGVLLVSQHFEDEKTQSYGAV